MNCVVNLPQTSECCNASKNVRPILIQGDSRCYEVLDPKEQTMTIRPYRGKVAAKCECPAAVMAEVGVKAEEVEKFVEHCESLGRNPVRLAHFLKPIEEAITLKLDEKGIAFHESDLPEYILTGKGHYIPGPAPQGYEKKSKGRIIDSVLLEKEQAMGLNPEGTPVFVGAVEGNLANAFIKHGYLFKEDAEVSTLILHGKNSHRFFFQAIMESLKGTPFEHLSAKAVLQLLVTVKVNGTSFWNDMMDNAYDTVHNLKINRLSPDERELLDDSNYTFSARSPFVFNSLILCFGKELGVPNLMHCMLDSHWKLADAMIERKREKSGNKDQDYIDVMQELTMARAAEIGRDFSFTRTPFDAAFDNKYHSYATMNALHNQGFVVGLKGIRTKWKRGEVTRPEERKNELFQLMKDRSFLAQMLKDASNQDLVVEFLAKEGSNELYLDTFRTAVFQNEPRSQDFREKLLAMEIRNHLKPNELVHMKRLTDHLKEKESVEKR